jgi:mannose-6-phosphate isomerase-like protein (cupin superfamily)
MSGQAIGNVKGFFIDDSRDAHCVTSWGEQSRVRVSGAATHHALVVLDYAAPRNFGPPRHCHRNDDEIFIVQEGTLVFWTPDKCGVARPGDLVMLPKSVPHTWRGYGSSRLRLQVIVSPGEFASFFTDVVRQGLTLADVDALTRVADHAGMDLLGPPLNDAEVSAIMSGEHIS